MTQEQLHTCVLCRKLVGPQQGVLFEAFGRRAFIVHRGRCSKIIQGGANALIASALLGTRAYVAKRAPRVMRLLEAVASATRRGTHAQ